MVSGEIISCEFREIASRSGVFYFSDGSNLKIHDSSFIELIGIGTASFLTCIQNNEGKIEIVKSEIRHSISYYGLMHSIEAAISIQGCKFLSNYGVIYANGISSIFTSLTILNSEIDNSENGIAVPAAMISS